MLSHRGSPRNKQLGVALGVKKNTSQSLMCVKTRLDPFLAWIQTFVFFFSDVWVFLTQKIDFLVKMNTNWGFQQPEMFFFLAFYKSYYLDDVLKGIQHQPIT